MSDQNGEQRVVIVTGTSRGIGLGCAQVFVDAGATVVGCDLDEQPNETLVAAGRYDHRLCDVSDPTQLEALTEWTASTYGRIDALVNNAGVHPPARQIDDVSVDDLLSLIQVNVVSVFSASKAALPHLRRTRGAIVNVASLVALVGQELAVEYCATKGAVAAMTRALAIDEAKHGVRVNSVSPGAVRTPLAEALNTPDQLQKIGGWAWMERLGTPREVGEVVEFLASDRAAFVTGQDVVISGGAELGYGLKGATFYDAMRT